MTDRGLTITLSSVSRDGRSRTAAVIVGVLNDLDIAPRLVTFASRDCLQTLRELAGRDLELCHVRIRRPLWAKGDALNAIALPLEAARRRLLTRRIIACDTAIHGYPVDARILKLVCFPHELVAEIEERYKAPLYRLYGIVSQSIYRRAVNSASYRGTFLANSQYTRDALLRAYPVREDAVTVVYAPASEPVSLNGEFDRPRARIVTVLGGFHPDKRQLEAVQLAREIPSARFILMGSARSRRYLQQCRREARSLRNVSFVIDASDADVTRILTKSRVLLHLKHNEHFGLATVEGILRGCVPFVHDSGGQREVVPLDALRFQGADELVSGVSRVLDTSHRNDLAALRKYVERFTTEAFISRVRPIVTAWLEPSDHLREMEVGRS